jgi:hypothetical protein
MGAIALPVAIAVVVTLTFNVIAGVVAARPRRAGRRRGLNSKVAPFAGWLPRRLFPVPPPEPDEAVGAEADRVARLAASA